MPYVYLFECDRCAHDVEVTVCKEFRTEPGGRRVDYEYPDPELYEWPPRRVSGLWSRLWCPGCRALRTAVVVELESPAEHPVQAFLAAEAKGITGDESPPCPECGTPLTRDPEGEQCPACADGALHCLGEYEP
jgi:hypothetical protein